MNYLNLNTNCFIGDTNHWIRLRFEEVAGMSESKELKKGEHEKAMEKAKEMLDRGCGMGEIIAETHLTEENVLKAREKMLGRL